MSVRAVVFDVGETLVDEERAWRELARAAGVGPHALWAALGVTIERGEEHRQAWSHLGVDPPDVAFALRVDDLYPDALPCLARARSLGLVVGIAGNQPAAVEEMLRDAGAPADLIASSASWGVEKPDPAFFDRIAAETGLPPHEIAHVGDRVDNDVLPAAAAGMVSVHLRRGPWGLLQDARGAAALVVDSLDGLPERLASLG